MLTYNNDTIVWQDASDSGCKNKSQINTDEYYLMNENHNIYICFSSAISII